MSQAVSSAVAPGLGTDALESFLQARRESSALTDRRRQAWAAYLDLPLPGRREEEWMRTDIRLLRWDRYGLPAASNAPAPAALLAEGVDLAGQIVSVNGVPRSDSLDASLARQGVVFAPLDRVADERPDLLERWLLASPAAFPDKFAALQAALSSGGAVLYVPPGVRLERPLHYLAGLAGGSDYGALLVVLDEGAEATLLTETAGDDQSGLHCGSADVQVQAGARLRLVSLQNWGRETWHFARHRARLQRGASLQWTIGALGGRLAKVNQDVHLCGPHAQAQVNGVMFTEGRQHQSYHTRQHHESAACKSDLLYKGALQEESRIVWRGMIKVDPAAQKTDAYQRNDNLILSETARADSIPGLEIEADDVRCTHGATAGRVDEEMVFYCRSRGLTRNEAVRLIVAGFFQQVFDRITIENVREALGQAIGRRIRNYV